MTHFGWAAYVMQRWQIRTFKNPWSRSRFLLH